MKNPVYSGTIEIYETDYGAILFNQLKFKFVGEPGTDQDTQLPAILSNETCFSPTTDGQEKCLPRRSPITPRHFVLTFNIATHKMPVASGTEIKECGTRLARLGKLKCIGYQGESVRNLQLLVSNN